MNLRQCQRRSPSWSPSIGVGGVEGRFVKVGVGGEPSSIFRVLFFYPISPLPPCPVSFYFRPRGLDVMGRSRRGAPVFGRSPLGVVVVIATPPPPPPKVIKLKVDRFRPEASLLCVCVCVRARRGRRCVTRRRSFLAVNAAAARTPLAPSIESLDPPDAISRARATAASASVGWRGIDSQSVGVERGEKRRRRRCCCESARLAPDSFGIRFRGAFLQQPMADAGLPPTPKPRPLSGLIRFRPPGSRPWSRFGLFSLFLKWTLTVDQ